MADTETVVAMVDQHDFVADGEIIAETTVHAGDVTDDILQQALEQASDAFENGKVVYTDENGVILDSVDVNEHELGIVAAENLTNSLTASDFITKQTLAYTIGDVNAHTENIVNTVQTIPLSTPVSNTTIQQSDFTQSAEVAGPLGSSANPIRIIQQGNQYVSMQQLSTEQIQQIMHVLQQQQVAKQTQLTESPTVLYNANTNTRVVYRVIQPSELHGRSTGDVVAQSKRIVRSSTNLQQSASGDFIETKRRRRRKVDDEDEKIDVPELTRQEKEEKKKHRPRTRSGRVSKPPKHMVKDYKHIHIVDWDEDYDDSDGGYSDFRESDHEAIDGDSKDSTYTHAGIPSCKSRPYKCETCEKSYIGHKGLSRHYTLNPTHGHLDPEETPSESIPTSQNGDGDAAVISESPVITPSPSESEVSFVPRRRGRPPLSASKRGRGRPSSFNTDAPMRRKLRLKDLVRQCDDEELMEIVLPRLTKSVTPWEFMMMKCERGKPSRLDAKEIYSEFESLVGDMKKYCKENFTLVPSVGSLANSDKHLEITVESIAQVLDLQTGSYEIPERPAAEVPIPITYNIASSSAASVSADMSTALQTNTLKRSAEHIASGNPNEGNEAKRPRITFCTSDLQPTPLPIVVTSSSEVQLGEVAMVAATGGSVLTSNGDKEVMETTSKVSDDLSEAGSVLPQGGQVMSLTENDSDDGTQIVIDSQTNVLQTSEGIVVIRNADGTVSLQGFGEQEIPIETVQALLAMEAEGQTQLQLSDGSV